MKFVTKMLKAWYYIFGLIIGITLFYIGKSRISLGINSIRLSDPYTAHFMNVGLLYIQISLLILVGLSILVILLIISKFKK